jgi:anaerobic dimethyl sulfoxide reductase subunit C (anchor subunit)
MSEWPLVLFTVLSQMAVGAVVTLWLLQAVSGPLEQQAGLLVSRGIVTLTGISMLISLVHLGHPIEAYRMISHLGSSWLSREAVLFGAFFLLTVAYWRQWKKGESSNRLGAVTGIMGILAVAASGMIYVLPAQPAWNNASPVLFFLLTAAVLGPLFVAIVLRTRQYMLRKSAYGCIAAALVCGLISFTLYLSLLFGQGEAAALTGANLLQSAALWPRVILGWAAPLGMLAYAAAKPEWDARSYVTSFFLVVLLGELAGRSMFYDALVALRIGGM